MVSRRAVLKSIGLVGLGGAALAHGGGLERALAQTAQPLAERWNGEPLGRIVQAYQPARDEPNSSARIISELRRDDVVRVRRVVRGERVYNNSDVWLETRYGYLYAAFIQPMRYHLPAVPQPDLGDGRWGEVIVPVTPMYLRPDPFDGEGFKGNAYYSCVFRVDDLVAGTDGKSWYRVREMYQTLYIRAPHLRLIPDEDLTPLSPDVPFRDKHLDINLTAQTITAHEYGQPVWASPISSGVYGYATPKGVYHVWDKRISERMVASTASDDPDFYNLPGVPFVCYFADWVATHGTYWHNDYGRPRSHGCVNVTSEAARWLWRWTTPPGSLTRLYVQTERRIDGTRIVVHD